MRYLPATVALRRVRSDDATAPVPFVASTEGVKMDGMDLRKQDWDLTRYLKYPVVLWGHDYRGERLPIGRGEPYFRDRALMIDVTYDIDDPFAMKVRAKALKGMIAGSVGWDTIKDGGETRNVLLEFSCCPLGMDGDSLPARARAFVEMRDDLLDDVVRIAQIVLRAQLSEALQPSIQELLAVVRGLELARFRDQTRELGDMITRLLG